MTDQAGPKRSRVELIFLSIVIAVVLFTITITASTFQMKAAPPTATPTVTLTPTATFTLTPTATITRTSTPTQTNTPSPTPTRTPTQTLTPSHTPLPSNTPTPFIFDQGPFERALTIEQIIPGIVDRFVVDEQGNIWLGSDYAVGKYNPGSQTFSRTNLRDEIIGITRDGTAWALDRSGSPLSAWDGEEWTTYNETSSWVDTNGYGLPSPMDPQILRDMNGDLWMTTAYDIRRFDGRQWRVFLPQEMGFDLPYRRTAATSFIMTASQVSEMVWAGSCDWEDGEIIGGNGLRMFDGLRWTETAIPAPAGCVTALGSDRFGYTWVGMNEQLWRYDENEASWAQFEPPALEGIDYIDYEHGVVSDIKDAPDGSVWVLYQLCGASGCEERQIRYRVQFGLWAPVRASSQLEPPLLLFDGNSTAWSLLPCDVRRFDDYLFESVATIDWIAADVGTEGNLWLLSGELNSQMILWRYVP